MSSKSMRSLIQADTQSLFKTASPSRYLCVITQQRQHSTRSNSRELHSSAPNNGAILHTSSPHPLTPPSRTVSPSFPLGTIPLTQILRTYLITSVSSSPILLAASTALLRRMIDSKSPLWNLERNPIIRAVLWETFYKQFCAGTTSQQINKTCQGLRQHGYEGVILEYALEVLKEDGTQSAAKEAAAIAVWRKGMLASVDMAQNGDFVGLKWSGMGSAAMNRMRDELPPTEAMEEAMHTLCQRAAEKNIALLPAAEETWNLAGFHDWTLRMQKVYNRSGKSVIYNTYQAYLKQTPATLASHLALAKRQDFTLGIKLVRGAYLASEKRTLIWPTIEDTHRAYDSIVESLVRRQYTGILRAAVPSSSEDHSLPPINVVLATHNAASVALAQSIRRSQTSRNEPLTPLVFAQLQGMADEVSCSLVNAAQDPECAGEKVFKCTAWGSMRECLNYLLRRAAENKDAASRTKDTREAMGAELGRRLRASVGLS